MPDDTIIIKAPAGTKARWVRQSQRGGMKLSDWLIDRVEAVGEPDPVYPDLIGEAAAEDAAGQHYSHTQGLA